jgi:hypothetical protein
MNHFQLFYILYNEVGYLVLFFRLLLKPWLLYAVQLLYFVKEALLKESFFEFIT